MGAFLDNTGLTTLVQLIKGSLPTKATSSTLGLVKPDNSTITVDSDGVISSSGGGSSYTAGDGINIDANGVISRKKLDFGEPLFAYFNSGLIPNFSLGKSPGSYNSLNSLAAGLKENKIAQTAPAFGYTPVSPAELNEAMGTSYSVRKFTGNLDNTISAADWNFYSADSTSNINTGERRSLQFAIIENTIYCGSSIKSLLGINFSKMILVDGFSNYQNCGNVNRLDRMLSSLDAATSEIAIRIPAAPTTDGNYVLKCSVSSGTPTYSWVSET